MVQSGGCSVDAIAAPTSTFEKTVGRLLMRASWSQGENFEVIQSLSTHAVRAQTGRGAINRSIVQIECASHSPDHQDHLLQHHVVAPGLPDISCSWQRAPDPAGYSRSRASDFPGAFTHRPAIIPHRVPLFHRQHLRRRNPPPPTRQGTRRQRQPSHPTEDNPWVCARDRWSPR